MRRGHLMYAHWDLEEGCPLPQLTRGSGTLGECLELPQQGPGQSPGRQCIQDIFQGPKSLLVETMHYGVYGIAKCEKL